MYLKRKIDIDLNNWVKSRDRKPLILRGARQVGKSTSVKNLSKHFKYYLEVNFEENRQVHKVFENSLDPVEICNILSLIYNVPVVPGETLIFFDEIQACLPAISSLRFFREKYSTVHIVAGGSLLDFALNELPSFGVGRIRSIFMYPFSFDEFLLACGEDKLLEAKRNASIQNPLPGPVHNKLIDLMKKFFITGGMPEAVATLTGNQKIHEVTQVLDDLLVSYRASFAKYKNRVPSSRILEVFESSVFQTGNKFVYSRVSSSANHKQVKEALDLLIMAGLVLPVTHSSANGVPLGAEANPKKKKILVFDTGIFQRLSGLDLSSIMLADDLETINKGAIAELFTGLELIKSMTPGIQHNLYYWQRETRSGNAEVDYVVQSGDDIVPIEVKSSGRGSMKSMFQFLDDKKRNKGIRFSLENYSEYGKISVYPLYAVSDFVARYMSNDKKDTVV